MLILLTSPRKNLAQIVPSNPLHPHEVQKHRVVLVLRVRKKHRLSCPLWKLIVLCVGPMGRIR